MRAYESRASAIRQRMEELSQRAALIADVSESNNRWLAAARSFQDPTELTRAMLEALVERIVITDPEHISIVWKFKDDFELLMSCASSEEEGA